MAPLKIALRIDVAFTETLAYLEEKGVSGWCVRENVNGENEHWHWYIESDAWTNIKAFRVALTRAVPELKGNGSYSAKETDETVDRYWAYMAKGDSEGAGIIAVWRHGLLWTDDYLEELHQRYWTENHVFKKQKLRHVDEVVLERCMEKKLEYDNVLEISKVYIKELFSRNKPINLFSVRSHCNLISLKLAPDVDTAVDKLVNDGRFL